MLNQFMRYLPLAQLVKNEHCRTVLEVGGGDKGINRYLPGQSMVGVDIKFKDAAAAATGRFRPVIGSALRLPFESGSFPVVVCSDVLEHIAAEDRETAIKELWRVAGRKVFLAFPVNETHGRWERLLLKTYKLLKAPPPDWLEDHIAKGLPNEADIAGILKRNRMPFTLVPNENNFVHFLVMLAEMTFLCGCLNFISDVLAPDTWDKSGHSWKANLVRAMFWPFRGLPGVFSFGSAVRKIFIIDKESSAAIPGGAQPLQTGPQAEHGGFRHRLAAYFSRHAA